VPELLRALGPVVETLRALGVRHYVGGSLASSAHGIGRASLDADVIADLRPEHVAPLVDRLCGAYYLDASRVRAAVESRRSFNAIHLATMVKVDVFVNRGRPFDEQAFERARPERFAEGPDAPTINVASPEDTVLAKLEWFRAGGEVSDRQWADIVGVLKVKAGQLDDSHLQRWASALGLDALLAKARAEAATS
jgi:hypothetical protein